MRRGGNGKDKGENNDWAGLCGRLPFPEPGKGRALAFVVGMGRATTRVGRPYVSVLEAPTFQRDGM